MWMLAIASKPLGIWFGAVGDAEVGSPLDRIVLTGLLLAGLVVLARRQFEWSAALRANLWLVLLLSYMLVSILWSEITYVAAKRWTRQFIVLVMAFVILSEPNSRLAFQSLLKRCFYILIPYSLLLIKYYPALGVEYGRWSGLQMWIGVTVQKNTLGRLCLVAAFFLLWSLFCHWKYYDRPNTKQARMADLVVLLIALFMLKGANNAYSATAIGTFAVGIGTFVILMSLSKTRVVLPKWCLLALVLVVLGFGVAAPFTGGSNVAAFSGTFGRNETLTGRTETWAELVPVVKSQPLLGAGIGSFWTTARREFYQMSHAHNGYLDILLEFGLAGLALYTCLLLSCADRCYRAFSVDPVWGSLGVCFLIMALVYNVSESALNSLAEQTTAIILMLSILVPEHERVASACSPSALTMRPIEVR
jgi:O-antigen ligase